MITYNPQNTKDFIFSVNVISSFADEGYFKITPNGLMSFGMGPSRIITYYFKMGDISLEEETESFGLNCRDLMKVFNRLRADENISIIYDKYISSVKIVASNEKGDKRTFKLKEIDVEYQEIPFARLFDLPYNILVKVNSKEFARILGDCEIYSEFISFIIEDGNIIAESSSVLGSVRIEKDLDIKVLKSRDFMVNYAIVFLETFAKNIGSKDISILLGYSEKFGPLPVYMNYEKGDGRFAAFVAPRVE